MGFIIGIDMFLIIGLLFFGIGAVKLLLDYLWVLLLGIVILIVLLVLTLKFPKTMLIILSLAVIISVAIVVVPDIIEKNEVTVRLSRATGDCYVHDVDGNVIKIPKGAVIAKYRDPKERQLEGQYYGYLYNCYWYYEGQEHYINLSNIHDAEKDSVIYQYYGGADNDWKVESLGEMRYKQFRKGQWWETVAQSKG